MSFRTESFRTGSFRAGSFRTESLNSVTIVTDQLERQFAAGRAERISDPFDLRRMTRLWRRSSRGPRQ
jgi:hypothetical protein